jgi:hypothetical protein
MLPDTSRTLTIASRFNGPPDSGNGGYVCGVFAIALEADVRVRLVAPPPLERVLQIEHDESTDAYALEDGDATIATALESRLELLDVPRAPPHTLAVLASQHCVGFRTHAFPTCFVCGPRRARGDGLRIFPGVLDSGIVAAPWLPADDLGEDDGKVAVQYHWAALDCPGYYAVVGDAPRTMVLGEMQAHVDRRVRVGESCTVIGWRLGSDGRKHHAGTAIFDGEGELCARARSTWIELRK